MSNGIKTKSSRIIDRYLMDIGVDKEETKRILRDHRLKSLPKEDHGVVQWEEWCEEQGYDIMPTLDTLFLFSESVIVPMEETANHLSSTDPTVEPLCGTKSYILPVMRLRKKLLELQEIQEQQMQRMHRGFHEDVEELDDNDEYHNSQATKSPVARSAQQDRTRETVNGQGQEPHHFIENLSVASIPPEAAPISTAPETELVSDLDNDELDELDELDDDDGAPLPDYTLATHTNGDGDGNTSHLEEVVHAVEVEDVRIQHSKFKAEEFRLLKKGSGGKIPKVPNAPKYQLHEEVTTVEDALQEWRFGFRGGPAIQDLNSRYGIHWRRDSDATAYTARTAVVKEFTVLVMEGGYTTEQAIAKLDIEQGASSLKTLRLRILSRRNGTGRSRKYPRYIEELRDNAIKEESTPLRESDEESDSEGDDPTDGTFVVNSRKRIAPSYEEEPVPPFPFPIRHLNSISDIWQEWVKGWEGEESFESLMQKHGKIWSSQEFWNEHNNYFYSRWRIVSSIKEAFQTGAVSSTTEAIQAMEQKRESSDTPASGFILSRGFKLLTNEWRAKVQKDPSIADA